MIGVIGVLIYLSYYVWTVVDLGSYVAGDVILAPLSFDEHPYSRIAVLGFALVGSLSLLYGLQLSKPSEQAVALAGLASAIGIVFSDNFITLFIFWEMLTLSTAGLILLRKTPEASYAGLYFLSFHLAGGLIVLLGILLHFQEVGNFILQTPQAGLTLFIVGFGFKAAFLPLHVWVARGYPSANFPSSVILAGLTTKIGVFAIARILPPNEVIMYMGASMAVAGVIMAMLQHNMRRLLSYHIISQVGYMVAGVGLATELATDGALLHVVNHMLYKALLFMSVGAVLYATGTEDLHDLIHENSEEEEAKKQNIWQAMPLVTFGGVVGALAISGIPLFNGYVSKYLLKYAFYDLGPVEVMLMIASIGTAASFCKLIGFGFIKGRAQIKQKTPISAQLAIVGTAAFCIILGVYPQLISPLTPYASEVHNIYTTSGIWGALQLGIAGLLLFLNLAALLKRGFHLPPWVSVEHLVLKPFGQVVYNRFCNYGTTIDSSVDNLYMRSGRRLYDFCQYITTLDKGIDTAFERSGDLGCSLAERTRVLDETIDESYTKIGDAVKKVAYRSGRVDESIDEGYLKTGHATRRMAERPEHIKRDEAEEGGRIKRRLRFDPIEWTSKNLNFDQLILALLLGVVLVIIFYFGR
ncbi:MAG: proton-conducting transporter membrane subunit [Bacillota bacterium]